MSPTILLSLPPMSAYFSSSPSSTSQPTVTPSLLSHLPSNPHIREKLLDMCEHVIRLNPCFNWPHFKGRIRALFNTDFSEGEKYCDSTGTDQEREHERAREILYGHAGPSFSTSIESPKSSVPTLSFFAAASAALALGALVWKEEDWEGKEEISRRPVSEPSSVHDMSGTSSENGTGRKRKTKVKGDHPEPLLSTHVIPEMDSACSTDPSFLHALSQQSLSISENYCPYDLDYLVGAILQVCPFTDLRLIRVNNFPCRRHCMHCMTEHLE
ncbi:hypothetical protein JAAARDRAFT_297834 [Jaapia argillacea MUCL 33604]|uniref:Uncharacterized protein n=1 Tax=Jaapia argillacea MUCL 33604 TaxID=933084 RepID=A0A067PPG1_9AGAM|nr:hypothetical protein JAAARDRAFT_297834 [Jaapia argillacea MUCL 33604]